MQAPDLHIKLSEHKDLFVLTAKTAAGQLQHYSVLSTHVTFFQFLYFHPVMVKNSSRLLTLRKNDITFLASTLLLISPQDIDTGIK